MHIFIKTHESGFEWILRDGSVTHADLESANEAELIFWNKEDRRRAPVRGDPRWRRCYVLIINKLNSQVNYLISNFKRKSGVNSKPLIKNNLFALPYHNN